MQIVNRTTFHVDFFVRSTTSGTMVTPTPMRAAAWCCGTTTGSSGSK